MRRIYQTEWFGIPFDAVGPISASSLADERFYNSLYERFFLAYGSWEELPSDWIAFKEAIADFVFAKSASVEDSGCGLLSVGCGLGYIEHALIKSGIQPSAIYVTEVSRQPLKWIKQELPASQISTGVVPSCLPQGRRWNFVYLVSVEYFLDREQLVDLLRSLKGVLSEGGRCLLISNSCDVDSGVVHRMVNYSKEAARMAMHRLRMRTLGQWWGWARYPSELKHAFVEAGYDSISSGIVPVGNQLPYGSAAWVEGCVDSHVSV